MKHYLMLFLLLQTKLALGSIEYTTISAHLGQSMLSHGGQEFPLVIYSSNRQAKNPTKFFIQAGLHGNEGQTTEFVNWMAKNSHLLSWGIKKSTGFEIHFLTAANPDNLYKSRYNKNFVNLNRNFSILWGISREPPGQYAFSEPETKAIRALMRKNNYLSAVDVHGFVNWIVVPSSPKTLKKKMNKKQNKNYHRWVSAITHRLKTILPSYELKSAGGLGDGGSFEDWAYWEGHSFSACLELHSSKRYLSLHNKKTDFYPVYQKFIQGLFHDAWHIKNNSTIPPSMVFQLNNPHGNIPENPTQAFH